MVEKIEELIGKLREIRGLFESLDFEESIVFLRNQEIFLKFLMGETAENLAKEFGITKERVCQICHTAGKRIRVIPNSTRKRDLRSLRKRILKKFGGDGNGGNGA